MSKPQASSDPGAFWLCRRVRSAGLVVGYRDALETLCEQRRSIRRFEPELDSETEDAKYDRWREAIEHSLNWVRDGND